MKDGFIFYRSFYESLKEVDAETRDTVLMAVCAYALDGEAPELSGVAAALFNLIAPQIAANQKRYEDGKKGGRPSNKKPVVSENTETEKPVVSEVSENKKPVVVKISANEKPKEKEKDKDIKENSTLTSTTKEKRGFTPPTVDEVQKYADDFCSQNGLIPIDAVEFCDFYASKGWMVGKNSMKDWRASIRNWARDDTRRNKTRSAPVKMDMTRKTNLDALLEGGNW